MHVRKPKPFSSMDEAGILFLVDESIFVAILRWGSRIIVGETCSRRRFGVENSIFWRRALISSSF
ncbi:hypothetical protein [Caldifermentibacillus hisashii]|uniref:hypothetical protein n=1 Tax=Caldifermentibacillus hisashii TaxID=996558 RepID=UPI00343D9CB6